MKKSKLNWIVLQGFHGETLHYFTDEKHHAGDVIELHGKKYVVVVC